MTLQGRTAKILLGVLAVSLAANIFAFSFIAGRGAGDRWRGPDMRAVAPYPPELRNEVRERLRERRSDMGPALRRLREGRRAMFEAARAPQVDRAALDAAMKDVREATMDLQAISQAALADALERASAEDRAAIRSPRAFNFMPNDHPPRR